VGTLDFYAVVRSAAGGGALVALPAEAAEVFGTRARFPVRAMCNGVEYRGSTMPMGDGLFCLGLTKAVRAEAGVAIGDEIHVVVVRDTEDRVVEVPHDLAVALEKANLTAAFASLAFTHRKEFARWIVEAKRPETRQRRLGKAIEMIMAGKRIS
jgi:Bacteriocin-protection, YdeI or OmpD-Associated/Domain of unknown function (DUF1905)